MFDPIETATQLVKAKLSGVSTSELKPVTVPSPQKILMVVDKVRDLPITKDSNLLKKQVGAETQKINGDDEVKLQQEKDKQIEQLKDNLTKLPANIPEQLSSFVKLPISDPKVLATLEFLKAQQEFTQVKQNTSKENLKKAKETFTFPMKPSIPTTESPKIPELPIIPTSLL